MTKRWLANLGDADPIEHGGYFVLSIDGRYVAESVERDGARWTVHRFDLDRFKLAPNEDGDTLYLVPFAYDAATWPHAVHMYQPWFAKNLGMIARTVGRTRDELIADLCSDDPIALASGYRDIAASWGYHEFDNYPLTLTRGLVSQRYRHAIARLSR